MSRLEVILMENYCQDTQTTEQSTLPGLLNWSLIIMLQYKVGTLAIDVAQRGHSNLCLARCTSEKAPTCCQMAQCTGCSSLWDV